MKSEMKEKLKEIEILGQVGKYRQDLVTEAMELSIEMMQEMNRQKLAEADQDTAASAAPLATPAA